MIKEFVERFDANRANLREAFKAYHKTMGEDSFTFDEWEIEYKDIVKEVVKVLCTNNSWYDPDPDRIYEIDDGDYQGTLVYVIAETGYQPCNYWYVKVDYGSCTGCDSLIRAVECNDSVDGTLDDIMLLALHIVQGLREMEEE